MVAIALMGQIAQIGIVGWRVGQLDKWREYVDKFIAEIREARGRSMSLHEEHRRRLARLERKEDEDHDDEG